MQLETMRGLRPPRKFEGERDGFALAGWLRLHERTPEGKSVVHLVRDLQRLMAASPELIMREERDGLPADTITRLRFSLSDSEKSKPPNDSKRALEIRKLARSIDTRFKNLFPKPSFLGFTTEGGRKRTFFWRFPGRGKRAAVISYPLERLGQLGLLHRVRQCQHCGMWIFARLERGKFCSAVCREKSFRASAAGREKRRKYMQRYRAGLQRYRRNLAELSRARK